MTPLQNAVAQVTSAPMNSTLETADEALLVNAGQLRANMGYLEQMIYEAPRSGVDGLTPIQRLNLSRAIEIADIMTDAALRIVSGREPYADEWDDDEAAYNAELRAL